MPQHEMDRESLLYWKACQCMAVRCAEFLTKFSTECAPHAEYKIQIISNDAAYDPISKVKN